MNRIELPKNANKLKFVYSVLRVLLDEFNDCAIINRTESPIKEYEYENHDGYYYRLIDINDFSKCADRANYIEPYRLDKMHHQGFTIDQYIEMCWLFELEEIIVVKKNGTRTSIDQLLKVKPVLSLDICPDGLNEIHWRGTLSKGIIEKISMI